ncbi:MAG: co-chaperone GroES family protein [Opitutaceae bacterium]
MTHRKLQPSGDHILIQYADATRARAAGPGTSRRKEKASVAKVIAVGPGQEGADGSMIPLGLKVGEKVFVNRSRGVLIKLNRRSYAVIRKHDLVVASA